MEAQQQDSNGRIKNSRLILHVNQISMNIEYKVCSEKNLFAHCALSKCLLSILYVKCSNRVEPAYKNRHEKLHSNHGT